MTATHNNSPVSLAAGSYDYDALKEGLDKAAKGAAKNYDATVAETLKEASTSPHAGQDPRAIAGYRFEDVEREDLGVTENIQVFDAKLAAKAEEETAEATPTTPTPAASASEAAPKAK